jgi:hypothetical protein
LVPIQALQVASGTADASQGSFRSGPGASPPPVKLVIHIGEDADVSANMRGIIPYVAGHLRLILASRQDFKQKLSDVEFHCHPHLEIKAAADVKDDELTSYKPPWQSAAATSAVQATGMYEASGNLFWCDPHWPEMEAQQVIAGDLQRGLTWRMQQRNISAANRTPSAMSGRRRAAASCSPRS